LLYKYKSEKFQSNKATKDGISLSVLEDSASEFSEHFQQNQLQIQIDTADSVVVVYLR